MGRLERAAAAEMAACLTATCLGVASTPVVAQTPAPISVEDEALPVTPEKLALAQKVVEATGAITLAKQAMEVMSAQMVKGFGQGDPAIAELLVKIFHEEMIDMQLKMRPLYAEIYAKSYTEQQLAEILAFYQSPTGRMMAAKAPQVLLQGQQAVAPLIPAMQRDMVVKLFDQMCSVKPCTPELRKQLAAAKQTVLDKLTAQQAAAAAAQAAVAR